MNERIPDPKFVTKEGTIELSLGYETDYLTETLVGRLRTLAGRGLTAGEVLQLVLGQLEPGTAEATLDSVIELTEE